MEHEKPRRGHQDQSKGFSLVITVSLMVLLAVLAVALLSLSAMSLRASAQSMARNEARANARLALVVALAELQKTMGPDRRISARAGTLARHPRLGVGVPAETPRFWWVGAATSDPEEGFDRSRPVGDDNPAVKWLISGLDADLDPGQQVSAAEPFENAVSIYGSHSIDTATFTGGSPIEAGIVSMNDDQGRANGGFAYMVDDQGDLTLSARGTGWPRGRIHRVRPGSVCRAGCP